MTTKKSVRLIKKDAPDMGKLLFSDLSQRTLSLPGVTGAVVGITKADGSVWFEWQDMSKQSLLYLAELMRIEALK